MTAVDAGRHHASGGTREIVDRVRGAIDTRIPLRIVGAGGWLDAGRPCRATTSLGVGAHAGVVEYEPGDLTLTARAGTSLAELARVTRAEGQ